MRNGFKRDKRWRLPCRKRKHPQHHQLHRFRKETLGGLRKSRIDEACRLKPLEAASAGATAAKL